LKKKGKMYKVTKATHVSNESARSSAIMQIELSEIGKGGRMTQRYRVDEEVEQYVLEFTRYVFQEKTEEGKYKFEAEHTDEEIELDANFIGESNIAYLQEETTIVVIRSIEGKPVILEMPMNAEFQVEDLKDAGGGWQKARLTNGRTISKVPPYIKQGETIVVKLVDETFVSRAED